MSPGLKGECQIRKLKVYVLLNLDLINRLQKRMKPGDVAAPKGGASLKESEEAKKEYSKLHDEFDYDNTNLNKLSDRELKKHK